MRESTVGSVFGACVSNPISKPHFPSLYIQYEEYFHIYADKTCTKNILKFVKSKQSEILHETTWYFIKRKSIMRQERRSKVINVSVFIVCTLLGAVTLDMYTWKVPNNYILICSITSAYILWGLYGLWGFVHMFIRFCLTIAILYIPYSLGGIGAGDVKLVAVISTLLTAKETMVVICLSVILGASMGIMHHIKNKQLFSRGREILFLGRSCVFYKQGSAFFQELRKGKKIHFTVCILIAYLLLESKEGVF